MYCLSDSVFDSSDSERLWEGVDLRLKFVPNVSWE